MLGESGSGRSMCLTQAVLHARLNGWIVMFVTSGWRQAQEGDYIEPVTTDDGELIFDNPMMTAELLRGFWYAHHNDLRRRPIQQTQKMEKYQSTIDKYKEDWKRALSMPGM